MRGDPFSTGILAALTQPFKAAYEAYCRTQDAYREKQGYWMRRD